MKTDDIYDFLHYVSEKFYGVDCSSCKTVCCVELKKLIKLRKKYNMIKKSPLCAVSKFIVDNERYPETDLDFCPNLDKETHRCKIYNERPRECLEYPFLLKNDNKFKVRNVTACLIAKRFMQWFMEFCSIYEQDYYKHLKSELEGKQYHNHFIIPLHLVILYLHYEFSKHNMNHQADDIMNSIRVLQESVG